MKMPAAGGEEAVQEIIYGTGNSAKIAYMKRALKDIPLLITGLSEAAEKEGILLPQIAETGTTVLENARLKAECYFRLFQRPVFSCDSGLYLWDLDSGMPLSKKEQPGIHVRRQPEGGMQEQEEGRLTDEQLLAHHISLVKKHRGPIGARYQNAICLIWDEKTREESMAEDLWGKPFLMTDTPHPKKVEGFPLDRISLDFETGKYFYDLRGNSQDSLVSQEGFASFFRNFMRKNQII